MYIIWNGNSSDHNVEHDAVCSYVPSQGYFSTGCRGITYVYHGYFGRLVINTKLSKIAIKRIQLDSYEEETETRHSIENEPNLLMELSNENILRCHCFGRDENFLFIATELCAGTLKDLVEGKLEDQTVIDKREMLRQITGAVVYLHEKKIVHRDIKPTNIFITHLNPNFDDDEGALPPQMKLADFGQSIRIVDDEQDFWNYLNENNDTIWGTMGWRAPELKASGPCNFKIDIFSLGLIFAYTLVNMTVNGYHPFDEQTIQSIINPVNRDINIEEGPIALTSVLAGEGLMKSYSSLARPLIESMMKRNPTERPTADQVSNNIFFSTKNDV